jgi:hypothetical protein
MSFFKSVSDMLVNSRDHDEYVLRGRKVEVPDERVKWDFEQHDRYMKFAEELLRLALGGIAVLGVLLGFLLGKDTSASLHESFGARLLLVIGGVFLFLACGCAMAARICAALGINEHLMAIKMLIHVEQNFWAKTMRHAMAGLKVRWSRRTWKHLANERENTRDCWYYLGNCAACGAAISLMIAALLFVAAIAMILLC